MTMKAGHGGVLVIGLGQMVCGVHNPNPTDEVTFVKSRPKHMGIWLLRKKKKGPEVEIKLRE